MAAPQTKRIMGIDPGTNTMGYGVLEICGNSVKCLAMDDVRLAKIKDPYEKLHNIFESVSELIDTYRPDEVALESPFFGENVQSMLKLGRAQGVAMAAALHKGLPVFEYAPRRIKQSITGAGGAAKEQVAAMLKGMLGIEYNPKRLDATDGLAVALCHHFTVSSPIPAAKAKAQKKSGASWEKFLSDNPERIMKGKPKK